MVRPTMPWLVTGALGISAMAVGGLTLAAQAAPEPDRPRPAVTLQGPTAAPGESTVSAAADPSASASAEASSSPTASASTTKTKTTTSTKPSKSAGTTSVASKVSPPTPVSAKSASTG